VRVPDTLRIAIGSDDAGLRYKEAAAAHLTADRRMSELLDAGASRDEDTHHPHVAVATGRPVREGKADSALLLCGTGPELARRPARERFAHRFDPNSASAEKVAAISGHERERAAQDSG
jgi:ribose 5-phosphate isomerase B